MKKGLLAILTTGIGVAGGTILSGQLSKKTIAKKEEKIDKFKNYYTVLNQWLINKNEGKNLDTYFIKNGYKTIAIYGMGEMGNRFYEEMQKSKEVKVAYAIDKNAGAVYSDLEVYDLDDNLEAVDAVIVTATFAYEDIAAKLEEVIDFKVISLEDVVFEV